MITVDVEAFYRRSREKPFDRLIWGRLDSGEGGIMGLMRIAEKHGMKLTMFVDFGEFGIHGAQIVEASKEIIRRGHDLQLHCHPEIIPVSFWEKVGVEPLKLQHTASDPQALAMVDYILEVYAKATSVPPRAYRGGRYMYNAAVLRALNARGVLINSSYNPGGMFAESQIMKAGVLGQFYWDNGCLELPVSTLPGFRSLERIVEFNFNASPFHVDEHLNQFLEKYAVEMPGNIAVLVMHCWSLQVPKDSVEFNVLQPEAVDRFDNFLKQALKKWVVVTASDVYNRISSGKSLSNVVHSLRDVEYRQQ